MLLIIIYTLYTVIKTNNTLLATAPYLIDTVQVADIMSSIKTLEHNLNMTYITLTRSTLYDRDDSNG